MDVFSVYDYNQPTGKLGQKESSKAVKGEKNPKAPTRAGKKTRLAPDTRPEKGQAEILAKVENMQAQKGVSRVEISRAAMEKNKKLPGPFDQTPNAVAEKAVEKLAERPVEKPVVEISVTSPIQSNDPSDTVTRDKLKEALQTGVVNFSAHERSVLEKIL